MKKVEIMAPAGSLKILKAAVDAGADAVYLGVGAYNARMNAENFTYEDLEEGAAYAHLRSTKVYLTLNTLVNDYEFEDALASARSGYDAGADGLIVQDIGLALKIREEYPEIPLVASTQMNIFSGEALEGIADEGFTRVVLPRELSLKEIKKRARIAKARGLETEVFIHGAVCVSCSGLCLFSSMNKSGSRSGNRGLCAQPCRQEYDIYAENTKIKSGHLLSPKDRCLVPYIADLIEAGVTSFKIEGRMREETYVVNTVRAYRKIVDAYYDGTLDLELENSVMNDLLVSFNRGGSFTSHYMSGKKDPEFLSGEYVGKYGLRMGLLKAKDAKKGTLTFAYDEKMPLPSKGDYLSLRQGSIELCSFPIGKIHEAPGSLTVKGLHPEMIEKIPASKVSVFLMGHDVELKREDLRKTHVDLSIGLEGDILTIDAKVNDGINLNASSYFEVDIPSDFEGAPLEHDRVEAQLRKTGDTPFVVDNVFFNTDAPLKCRISLINELRRGVMEQLELDIKYRYERPATMAAFKIPTTVDRSGEPGSDMRLHVFPSFKRIKGEMDRGADIYGFSFYDLCVKNFRSQILNFINGSKTLLAVIMPDFCHDAIADMRSEIFDIIRNEIGDRFYAVIDSDVFGTFDETGLPGVKHFLSAGANAFNGRTLSALGSRADGAYISYETSPSEAEELLREVPRDVTLLLHTGGLIPWMQSSFCAVGAHKDGCRSCYDPVTYKLKGEGDKECVIISRPADCSSTIYGPSKFTWDEDSIDTVLGMGFNTISVEVEI